MHFKTSTAFAMAAIISQAFSHCVLTSITGANGVTMPGLSVIDGTPRDCATPGCGAEADTSIIRNNGSPLGKTNGGGQVDAAAAVSSFMGTGATSRVKRHLVGTKATPKRRGLLDKLGGGLLGGGLLGGGAGGAAGGAAGGKAADAVGTKTPKGTVEDGVSASAGAGATSGLPTVGADGVLTMNLHQPAEMIADVPGAIAGLSGTTTTDFPIKVQMPAGMTCSGTVAGVKNVCVVRVKNSALAGPFGGSAVFTQDTGAASTAGNTTATAAARRDLHIAFRA